VLPVVPVVDWRSADPAAEPVLVLIVAASRTHVAATAAVGVPPVPADDVAPPAFVFDLFVASGEDASTRWRHPTTVISFFVLLCSRAER
jgi:hypothetical protein